MKLALSVVIPIKNGSSVVRETIESYQKQTYDEWEMVIINDHSSDNTKEIVIEMAKVDQRIRIYDLTDGTGISFGRNLGSSLVKSEIIVSGDGDDLAEPSRLEIIYNSFKQNNIDVFYSNAYLWYQDTNKKISRPFQPFNNEVLKNVNFIPNSTTAYRKLAFDSIGGYDTTLKMSEDYDLWLSFSEKKYAFGFDPRPLMTIRRNNNSTTSDNKNELRSYIDKVKLKHGLPIPASRDFLKNNTSKEIYDYFTTPGGLKLWF